MSQEEILLSKLIEIVDKKEQIEMNKVISRLLTESRNLAKLEKCLICNTDQTSFCNSHSISQFSLKNIAVEGEVYAPSTVMGWIFLIKDKVLRILASFI